MLGSPCKDCSKRFVNCHSRCEDYITYSKELEKIRKLKREESKKLEWAIDRSKAIRDLYLKKIRSK